MARDLFDHVGFQLRRVAAGLQQRQDQRGEFVPHGQAGEADAGALFTRADLADAERRAARVVAAFEQTDLVGQAGDILQQATHFGGLGAVVE